MKTQFKFFKNKPEILEPLYAPGVVSLFRTISYIDPESFGGENNLIFIYGREDYRTITEYLTVNYSGPICDFYREYSNYSDVNLHHQQLFVLPKIPTINTITVNGFTYGNGRSTTDIRLNNPWTPVEINYKVYLR